MIVRRLAAAFFFLLVIVPLAAWAQGAPGAKPGRALTDQEIRDLLVFNSPWESSSTTPGQLYRYRTTFVMRGNDIVAQVMRYATNEQGDSIVTLKEGRVVWQDTAGADVSVAVEGQELVGSAVSKTSNHTIRFRARP